MQRMQALRLMPSHTYFYRKLSQYGKDHDQEILSNVEKEGKRRTALAQRELMKNKPTDDRLLSEEILKSDVRNKMIIG